MNLHEHQSTFAAALLDADLPVPPGLVGPDGQPSARRFAVYRNNVVAGLTNALMDAYPAIRSLVGDDFFRAAAAVFVTRHPPEGPVMLHYGGDFANFLATFPPLADHPYMADVARVERARVLAWHAPEVPPMGPDALADVGDPAARAVMLHPSVQLVTSDWPAGSIWQANAGDTPLAPQEDAPVGDGPEAVLIARPATEVTQRLLPPAAAALMTALIAGESLGAAAGAALAAAPGVDVAEAVAFPFADGLVIGWRDATG